MKTYTFSIEYKGEQITIVTVKANNKKEARENAQRYKRMDFKKEYPNYPLNKVTVI